MIVSQLLRFVVFLLHRRTIYGFLPIFWHVVLIMVVFTNFGCLSVIDIESLVLKALDVEDFTGLQVDHASAMPVHYYNKWIALHIKIEIWLHKIANVDFVYALSIKLRRKH